MNSTVERVRLGCVGVFANLLPLFLLLARSDAPPLAIAELRASFILSYRPRMF